MSSRQRRIVRIVALSSGLLLASGCSVADQVLATIEFAFRIVDVWV